jgi:hypothetical protein
MARVLLPVLGAILLGLGMDAHAETPLLALIETKIHFTVSADQIVGDYRLRGDELSPFLPKYIESARKRGVAVYVVSLLEDTHRLLGLASCPNTLGGHACVILIDNSTGANGQVATLLHELAHVESPKFKTVNEAEVFAETVAYLVLAELGYDNRIASMSYLWNLGPRSRYVVLTENERTIKKLAERLAKVGKA